MSVRSETDAVELANRRMLLLSRARPLRAILRTDELTAETLLKLLGVLARSLPRRPDWPRGQRDSPSQEMPMVALLRPTQYQGSKVGWCVTVTGTIEKRGASVEQILAHLPEALDSRVWM